MRALTSVKATFEFSLSEYLLTTRTRKASFCLPWAFWKHRCSNFFKSNIQKNLQLFITTYLLSILCYWEDRNHDSFYKKMCSCLQNYNMKVYRLYSFEGCVVLKSVIKKWWFIRRVFFTWINEDIYFLSATGVTFDAYSTIQLSNMEAQKFTFPHKESCHICLSEE